MGEKALGSHEEKLKLDTLKFAVKSIASRPCTELATLATTDPTHGHHPDEHVAIKARNELMSISGHIRSTTSSMLNASVDFISPPGIITRLAFEGPLPQRAWSRWLRTSVLMIDPSLPRVRIGLPSMDSLSVLKLLRARIFNWNDVDWLLAAHSVVTMQARGKDHLEMPVATFAAWWFFWKEARDMHPESKSLSNRTPCFFVSPLSGIFGCMENCSSRRIACILEKTAFLRTTFCSALLCRCHAHRALLLADTTLDFRVLPALGGITTQGRARVQNAAAWLATCAVASMTWEDSTADDGLDASWN